MSKPNKFSAHGNSATPLSPLTETPGQVSEAYRDMTHLYTVFEVPLQRCDLLLSSWPKHFTLGYHELPYNVSAASVTS